VVSPLADVGNRYARERAVTRRRSSLTLGVGVNTHRVTGLRRYGPARSKWAYRPGASGINHHNLDSCPATTPEPSIATVEGDEGFCWLVPAAGISTRVERTDSLKNRDGWAQE
jgi:hypothetical protein